MNDLTTGAEALEPIAPPVETSPDRILSMQEAIEYLHVNRMRIREAIKQGDLPATRADQGGAKAAYLIKKSDLDRLVATGKFRTRKYVRRNLGNLNPDKLTIKQAAEVTGIGFSTIQAYSRRGELPSTKVQVGPNTFQRYVRLADVEALKIMPSQRGKWPRKKNKKSLDVASALVKAGKVSLSPTAAKPEVNLDSELLRLADMVRSGSFRVTKLTVNLEFTGGQQD